MCFQTTFSLAVFLNHCGFYLSLNRCDNLTTTEASEDDVTSQDDEETVRKHLNLPLSSGDVTAECVASNQVGEFREVFQHRTLPENAATVHFQPCVRDEAAK